MREIEVKVLDIDRPAVELTLAELSARPSPEERLTAVFFDSPDGRLRVAGNLLRLRREGDRVLLTFKRRVGEEGAKVREEIEVGVSDFEACRLLLNALGLAETAHVDKFRTSYRLDTATIAIDRHVGEHLFIPEFLEIEAGSIEEVQAVAARLGFAPETLRPWGLPQVIEHYRARS
ncbi:MAG TPA: class IV adenylate cyclase [bacterium]|nr:class IV adenylate cyclase [bacterium]